MTAKLINKIYKKDIQAVLTEKTKLYKGFSVLSILKKIAEFIIIVLGLIGSIFFLPLLITGKKKSRYDEYINSTALEGFTSGPVYKIKKITEEHIFLATCRVFCVDIDEIKTRSKKTKLVNARKAYVIATYLHFLKEVEKPTYAEIGYLIDRDHSNISHYIKDYNQKEKTSKRINKDLNKEINERIDEIFKTIV